MYGAIQNTAETAELSRTLKEFGHSFHRNSFSGSSSIESLARAVMTAYPSVKLQHGKSGFTVFGEGEFGFPISVEDLGTTRLLYLGPGITEFDSDENVLDHLLQALLIGVPPDRRAHWNNRAAMEAGATVRRRGG